MKRLMEVHIFGQTFTVTSEDDEQYVREIASFVDQRMRQIAENAKVTVPFRVAIMAALSIADELAKSGQSESSRQEAQLMQEAELISSRLLERLEKAEGLTSEATADNTLNSQSAGSLSATLDREERT